MFSLNVAHPMVTVGLAVGAGWYRWSGPGGWTNRLVVGGLILLAFVVWFGGFAWLDRSGADFIAYIVLSFVCVWAFRSVEPWVLASRGTLVTCRVGQVEERTEKEYDEGGTLTVHYFDHELLCPGGYPEQVTSRARPAAEVEDQRRVRFDPEHRVAPQFAGHRRGIELWLAVVGLAVSLALIVGQWIVGPNARHADLRDGAT